MIATETMFSIANFGVLPFWLLLAFAPHSALTRRLVHAPWVPLGLGAVYLVYIFSAMTGSGNPDAGFGSLPGVMAAFTAPTAALAGWVHYLVFDLFVGAWQVRDAQRRNVPHLAVLPCLALTLMFGPVGLAAYLLIRGFWKKVWTLDED